MRLRSAVLVLFLVSVAPTRTLAQGASLAEVLYTDGQRLVGAGEVHEACLKFGESQRIDPRLNTLIALAACHEKDGKTATAWGEFLEAAEQASARRDPTREQFSREHAAILQVQIHRVVIAVASPPPGVELTLDGKAYGAGTMGSSIPLDPGDHELAVTAPGKRRWAKTVRVDTSPGEERIDVTLDDEPAAPSAPIGTAESKAKPAPSLPPQEKPVAGDSAGGARKTSGIVVGATGCAALVVGAVAGIVAIVDAGDENGACGPGGLGSCSTNDRGAVGADRAAAVSAGTVADVGLIAGAVLVGVGTLLYLLTPSTSGRARLSLAPRLGPASGGGALVATW